MQLSYMLLALVIGSLIPFQAIINARLAKYLESSMLSALISFAVGLFGIVIFNIVMKSNFSNLMKVTSTPWYYLLGGFIGACFVYSSIVVVPKFGATNWIAFIIAGQLIMSIILDHFGFLDLSVQTVSPKRIFGIILLYSGALLIAMK